MFRRLRDSQMPSWDKNIQRLLTGAGKLSSWGLWHWVQRTQTSLEGMAAPLIQSSCPLLQEHCLHSEPRPHTDPVFGSWRTWGGRGGRNTGFKAKHLGWKSSVAVCSWTSQTPLPQCSCLSTRKTKSSLNFYAALVKWWIWNSVLNSRAFYKYLARNIPYYVHI